MSYIYSLKTLVSDFFKKGHVRSIEAKKNIAASFLIKGVSIAISLALVPMTIKYVNPTQYGIWLTLSSIVAWFSFFDMGFGNGMRNRFAEAKAKGDMGRARSYISTTYAVLSVIFLSVWLIFFIVNFFIDWSKVLNAPAHMADELSTLALIVFTFFCLQIVFKTINTVLIADQKPAKASFINMIGQFMALAIIFILTKTTRGSLLYLGLALGFAPIIIMLISSAWFYRKEYRNIGPSVKYVRFSYARDIMGLGIKFFIIQIAAIVIYQTSNIIIAHVCSPEDVTVYNIAYKYFGVGTMVFSIIITPFWSAFTDAYASNDFKWMTEVVKKLHKIVLLLIAAVLLMLIVSPLAYHLWVGKVVIVRTTISAILAIYVLTNIWNSLNSMILNGMGKIKLQLYVSITGMIFFIPLAIFCGKKLGIEGVVLSAIMINVISAVYAPVQVSRLLRRKAEGVWNE